MYLHFITTKYPVQINYLKKQVPKFGSITREMLYYVIKFWTKQLVWLNSIRHTTSNTRVVNRD